MDSTFEAVQSAFSANAFKYFLLWFIKANGVKGEFANFSRTMQLQSVSLIMCNTGSRIII